MVDDQIIIENKTVETILPIHEAQIMAYLKLNDRRLGFLLNWNVKLIRNRVRRIVPISRAESISETKTFLLKYPSHFSSLRGEK